jgi:PAS domain S-box-containing protein
MALGATDISDVFIAWGPVFAPVFAAFAAIVSAMYAKGAHTLAKHTDREVNNKKADEPTLRQMVVDMRENQKTMLATSIRHEKMLCAIEHSMSQNDARIRHILSALATFEADESGQYIWVSRRWTELTGITLADAKGRTWEEAVYSIDRQRVTDEWSRAVAEHESFGPTSLRLQHKRTAEVIWVIAEASPVRNSDGNLVGYVGSIDMMALEGWEDPPRQF